MSSPHRVEALRLIKGGIALLDDQSELDRHALDRILTDTLASFRKEIDRVTAHTLLDRTRRAA
jgi:hypothetical protein